MIISISAENEASAFSFVRHLIPKIYSITRTSAKAALLYDCLPDSYFPDWMHYHERVEQWSFNKSAKMLRSLNTLNINTLLISRTFLNWHTDCQDISVALESFGAVINVCGMDVVYYGSYGKDIPDGFVTQDSFSEESAYNVLEYMVNSNERPSAITPFGYMSEFILEPDWESCYLKNESVRAMVGLPSDTFNKYPRAETFPYLNLKF